MATKLQKLWLVDYIPAHNIAQFFLYRYTTNPVWSFWLESTMLW